MTVTLKPITITPEQIMAAAQKIVNQLDDAWEYSEADVLRAVESYLRCKVSDILADADWHANQDNFDVQTATKAQPSLVDEASELIMPQAPAPSGFPEIAVWAYKSADGRFTITIPIAENRAS